MAAAQLAFQRLDVYRVAKEALAIVVERKAQFRGLGGELGPQMQRAMVGVLLNIAEGAGRWSAADQRRHYQIACGSATEVAACLDVAELHGVDEAVVDAVRSRVHRVVPMLLALIRARAR